MLHRSGLLYESRIANAWLWFRQTCLRDFKKSSKIRDEENERLKRRELFSRSRQLGSRRVEPLVYKSQNVGSASSLYDTHKKRNTSNSSEGIHLYSQKANASDDKSFMFNDGMEELKNMYRKMAKHTLTTSIMVFMFLLSLIGLFYGYQKYLNSVVQNGLIGPKRKNYTSRLTIVLDVDETIVSYGDKAFRLHAGLVPRPYLVELLEYLNKINAEVVLWGACSDRYMREVLSIIDPNGTRISTYVSRDKSWFSKEYYYEKNVYWLHRSLDDVLMVENRALSARNSNKNTLLVEDFIRAEYMDDLQDYPPNDKALLIVRKVVEDLEKTGMPVPEYLAQEAKRNTEIHSIPCHLAIRQLPEELAHGVFYFIGNKYKLPSRVKELKEPQITQGNKK